MGISSQICPGDFPAFHSPSHQTTVFHFSLFLIKPPTSICSFEPDRAAAFFKIFSKSRTSFRFIVPLALSFFSCRLFSFRFLVDVASFMAFPIPGTAASAQRHDCLVAPHGTLTLAAHPMALPAASRSALTTSPIDTLSPLAPDTAWPNDEAMSYVELNINHGWATRPRNTHETLQHWPRLRNAPRSHRDLSHREKWSAA